MKDRFFKTENRRAFIKTMLAGTGGAFITPLTFGGRYDGSSATGSIQASWEQVPAILNRIKPPLFPQRDFAINHYGAIGDGKTDCHQAFAEAINHCNVSGGGRIVVPAGIWWTNGPVHLKSNVHLYLSEGATIRFNPDPELYLPMVLTRWEGTELFNYSPLIYAYQSTNVAITGKGIIDGNAKDSFAIWKPRQKDAQNRLRQMGAEGVPVYRRVFGKDHWLRPSTIQFFGCRNILVEGITVLDAPFWVIHPVYCQNVTVRGIYVNSWNANNDGVDPDSSVDVLIENCRFETGDDGVAIKSGRDQDAWRIGQATENVVVRGCDMNSKANGLCIGSEMSGGVRNVFMEHCRIGRVDSAIYFKANLDRGGSIEHVCVRDITVEETDALINFTTDYHGYRGGHYPPMFRDFVIENVMCKEAKIAINAVGVPDSPLQDVRVENVTVHHAAEPYHIRYVENFVLEEVLVNGSLVSLTHKR